MSTVLVIVAVVVVLAIVGWVMMRRRASGPEAVAAAEEPAGAGAVPVAGAPRQAVVEEKAEPAGPAAEPTGRVAAEPEVAEAAKEPEPAKPKPTTGELKERVEANLGDSKQMLEELRARSAGEAESTSQLPSATLEIMAEGLEEVQGLATRKEWSQAKDKADALHAQLKLLLQQTARREGSS